MWRLIRAINIFLFKVIPSIFGNLKIIFHYLTGGKFKRKV